MEEKWSVISEFPMYSVSNLGRVMNHTTGKLISTSQTRQGLAKVSLVNGGVQFTRGLAILVAEAFVFGRNETFNTPIHLNGDQTDNRAENLMWRPRWFAWKYFQQFEGDAYQNRGPIRDVATNIWYETVHEAGTKFGLLFKDIMRSVTTREGVFPTFQVFTFRD